MFKKDNQNVDRLVKPTHYNFYELCLHENSLLGDDFRLVIWLNNLSCHQKKILQNL